MWRRVVFVIVLCQAVAGCTLGGGGSAPAVHVASPMELRILRESFADPGVFQRVPSIAALSNRLPLALVRPDATLASDRSIDSIWASRGDRNVVVVWKSGVVETVARWRCNCEAAASLRDMGRRKPFHFLTLRGAPAITAPSDPLRRDTIGPLSRAQAAYGVPASVETIRDGYNITLWQYGAHTQRGLMAAARTLPVARPALRTFGGYEAAGSALGDWHGAEGIDVAPHGGATFGIGVAVQNVTGKPLTITGVTTLDGFIRLIGIHLRPTAPASSPDAVALVRPPYDATSNHHSYVLRPKAWVGMQLDFQVRSPCLHWSQLAYDRTVEVAYTQDGAAHLQEVPMVPLTITHRRFC